MIAAGRRSKTCKTAAWIRATGSFTVPKVSTNTPTGWDLPMASATCTSARSATVIFDGDRRLAVRTQIGDGAILADRREPARQPMRQCDRQRHQLRSVATRVAEHQALIAGALPVQFVEDPALTRFAGIVHALRDVGRLRTDR